MCCFKLQVMQIVTFILCCYLCLLIFCVFCLFFLLLLFSNLLPCLAVYAKTLWNLRLSSSGFSGFVFTFRVAQLCCMTACGKENRLERRTRRLSVLFIKVSHRTNVDGQLRNTAFCHSKASLPLETHQPGRKSCDSNAIKLFMDFHFLIFTVFFNGF